MAEITMRQAINLTLREEMRKDESIFLIGEDMGTYGGNFDVTQGLLDEFGEERVIDSPISEGGFTGLAVGAAMAGMRPIVEIMFCDFAAYAMDAIINQAAKQHFMSGGQNSVPLTIRMTIGSGKGAAAQHSQSLEALFCHIPGLKVVCPSGARDAKGLLASAIHDDGPVIFLEHKLCYDMAEDVPVNDYSTPIGRASVKRSGKDISLISYAHNVHKCMQAAAMLEKEGIDAEVIDVRSLSPLDTNIIISSVKKTGRAFITHEAVGKFGVGAEIASVISGSEAFYSLKMPVVRFCGNDMPTAFNADIEAQSVPQAETIFDSIKTLLCDSGKIINML